jgi:hypothetical protein
MDERIDVAQRRYETRIHGRGEQVEATIESTGVLRDDRWAPVNAPVVLSSAVLPMILLRDLP